MVEADQHCLGSIGGQRVWRTRRKSWETITAISQESTTGELGYDAKYRLDYWNEYDDAAKAYVFAGEMVVEVAKTEENQYLEFWYCIESSTPLNEFDCFRVIPLQPLGSGS